MVGRRTEKLMERFVGPYKIKKVVLSNMVELELPTTIKIHPVVNVSRMCRYMGQVEGQRKEQPAPVIICYKLHLAISPSILYQFSWFQWLWKALKKTF